jgi:hypothetical protein
MNKIMGTKILWTGLTILLALEWLKLPEKDTIMVVGSVIMIIGLIMLWLNK